MKVENEELLPIGRFARLTGMTAKALRHYDRVGLLRPTRVDSWTGYRWYALAQARDAEAIRRLRALELPLEEIAAVLGAPDAVLRERLAVHRAHLEGRAVEVAGILAELDRLIDGKERLVSDERIEYTIDEVPERTYAVVRREARMDQLPVLIPQLIGRTAEWAFAHGRVPGAPAAIYRMMDDEVVDVRVGWPVSTDDRPPAPIEVLPAGGGRAVVATHVGDYSELTSVWRRLYETLRADGVEPRGELHELYETSPDEVASPAEHVTRLLWDLE